MLKRNSMRFAAGLLAALASFVAGPNAALRAQPQHQDQAPGFYRLKVGDLEVTALYDGTGVFGPRWLNGTTATMDGVLKALHEDPHLLDVADAGFLVNTGKQLILVDVGTGTWWGGGAFGRLAGSLRSAGYTPEAVGIVLVTHLHSDHVGGLTTQDGKRVFPNAEVYVAKAESDFWLSPATASASFQMPMCTSRKSKATFGCRRTSQRRRPRMHSHSSRARKPSRRRTSRPVSGIRSVAPRKSSTAWSSSPCLAIPRGIPAMNFRREDKKSCFGVTSSMRCVSSCSIPRSPRCSTSTRLRLRRRGINCC